MAETGYTQHSKNMVRHQIIRSAVSMLTDKRAEASCVSRDYVRRVYDHFTQTEDANRNKQEALNINSQYILDWENLHDSFCGVKRPSDLNVCYLCGPEPNNDFDELVGLGILPQNIWAFESKRGLYEQAIAVYKEESYRQPRILKQNIETFFQQTPKKFDIIYIDACGSIPSDKHALRCISNIFLNHRLNSPGIIISNFAEPDVKTEYIDLLTSYFFSKENLQYEFSNDKTKVINKEYNELREKIKLNFPDYYGNFISRILRDIPGVIVPIQRMWKNPYLNQIFEIPQNPNPDISEDLINQTNDSIARFFFTYEYLKKHGKTDNKIKMLTNEVGDYETFYSALIQYEIIKTQKKYLTEDTMKLKKYFDDRNTMYQFLDRPHSNLLFDVLLSQLSYPFHCNTKANKRFKYIAKSTPMYTDITVYDECRYLYEWLPAMHQIQSAFANKPYQYVFRFALDGLVKSRQLYNNEFFYQGSVVSDSCPGFELQKMEDRLSIDEYIERGI